MTRFAERKNADDLPFKEKYHWKLCSQDSIQKKIEKVLRCTFLGCVGLTGLLCILFVFSLLVCCFVSFGLAAA